MVLLQKGDCLELMKQIPDKSIDMILCDLPYGTTSSWWDIIIPFDKLWEQYERIIKPLGAVVLFGTEPFTSQLIMSNPKLFKYNWYWNKTSTGGFVNAKYKPMHTIETISVFSFGKTSTGSKSNMVYYPQGLKKCNVQHKMGNKIKRDNTYARPSTLNNVVTQEWTNYPRNYLEFRKEGKCVHPCQKPIPLLEYLIKTYTKEGDMVLDNCMGSGSTGVACVNTGRSFIGMEQDEKYFEIASNRIDDSRKILGVYCR